MNALQSDALVFFGATGDLAYKKIFPSLQTMVKRGHLDMRVIGVAKAGWNLDQLQTRVQDSVEKHGVLEAASFDKLCGLLRYVDGDYQDLTMFQAIRQELGSAKRPLHYLAIPPVLFGTVVEHLAKSGCNQGARVVLEKPFGTDLASARELNRILLGTFPETMVFRSIIISGNALSKICCISALRMRSPRFSGTVPTCRACRSPWRSTSASRVGGLL